MKQKNCVVCESPDLFKVLNLGNQPIVNQYLKKKNDKSKQYPLIFNACKVCGHGQQGYFVKPEIIFKNYIYASGTSQTLKKYFAWLSDQIKKNSTPKDSLLEIASNDGSFLSEIKKRNLQNIGIDPASKMVKIAKKKALIP